MRKLLRKFSATRSWVVWWLNFHSLVLPQFLLSPRATEVNAYGAAGWRQSFFASPFSAAALFFLSLRPQAVSREICAWTVAHSRIAPANNFWILSHRSRWVLRAFKFSQASSRFVAAPVAIRGRRGPRITQTWVFLFLHCTCFFPPQTAMFLWCNFGWQSKYGV